MKVILYSTHCPRCKVLENKLQSMGIPYEEVTDLDTMKELGIMSAPMLSVDGELMNFSVAINKVNEISARVGEEV